MTTATSSTNTYGVLYLRGDQVNEALAWRGLNVLDDGRMTLNLTGYAQGVGVEIVFNNTAEFIAFATTMVHLVEISELEGEA